MIGRKPTAQELSLTPGQDFTHRVEPPAPYQFQPETALKIVLFDSDQWDAETVATFSAAVDLLGASWLVQSEVTDLLGPDEVRWFRLYISYPDSPTTDHCWFSGPVIHST